jgi:hypothetical protein
MIVLPKIFSQSRFVFQRFRQRELEKSERTSNNISIDEMGFTYMVVHDGL